MRLLDTDRPQITLIGAHCDDLEIGAGGLLLRLSDRYPSVRVRALVLTSTPEREAETRAALPAFLPRADVTLDVLDLPDGRLPGVWDEVKDALESLRSDVSPDLVVAPRADDAHQDHALVGSLVTTAFRDHLVLHYEILKWDADLTPPTLYLPLADDVAERKWELLHEHFASQRSRDWFDRDAILGLARLRGVECHARYAEAFHTTKAVLTL
ncbi:PIG-L deacetylase family protein [Jatrophihabitans sp. YIM 134969]